MHCNNLYAEQQVSAHCAEEQLIAEGTHACYADVQSPDSLRKNNHNAEDTIPERVTRLQRLLFAHLHFHSPNTLLISRFA